MFLLMFWGISINKYQCLHRPLWRLGPSVFRYTVFLGIRLIYECSWQLEDILLFLSSHLPPLSFYLGYRPPLGMQHCMRLHVHYL